MLGDRAMAQVDRGDVGPVRDDRACDMNDAAASGSHQNRSESKKPGVGDDKRPSGRPHPHRAYSWMVREVVAAGYHQNVVTQIGDTQDELLELALHAANPADVMSDQRDRDE